MPPLRIQKQEKFCIEYINSGNGTASAVLAKYSVKSAGVTACRLLKNNNVLARLNELRERIESKKVMNVQERKERLSEIARAKLTNFMELGKDGSWVNIGAETEQGGAIQEIHSRTEYDENGSHPTLYTSVKLHDPVRAIQELNKMEKIYIEGTTVNVDNRKIEVQVVSENAKQLTDRILSGEGT